MPLYYRAVWLSDDLGSYRSSCIECGGMVWGWWLRLYDTTDSRHMARNFNCSSPSTVDVRLTAYFCEENPSNQEIFYFDRYIDWGSGPTKSQHIKYNSSYSNIGGSGTNKPGTTCDAEIRAISISDTFSVMPTQWIYIGISQAPNNNTNNAIAFNNFKIKCTPLTTSQPTKSPTVYPTMLPTQSPTDTTISPTHAPSKNPSKIPTDAPTTFPTKIPTKSPTTFPTKIPTKTPTTFPTKIPTESPTIYPTILPTQSPTDPIKSPTYVPSKNPTKIPTDAPTTFPTDITRHNPTNAPYAINDTTLNPSRPPTKMQTYRTATIFSTNQPTPFPTELPTVKPTKIPTEDAKTGQAISIDPTVCRLFVCLFCLWWF